MTPVRPSVALPGSCVCYPIVTFKGLWEGWVTNWGRPNTVPRSVILSEVELRSMFADAVEKAQQFTHPLIICKRLVDGSCVAGLGAYVVLNDDGWILTAGHILKELETCSKESRHFQDYQAKLAKSEGLPKRERQAARRSLTQPKAKSARNWSAIWTDQAINGGQNPIVKDAKGIAEVDLGIARLEPFDASRVKAFPVIVNPDHIRMGTSLVRLGFPFHSLEPTFSEAEGFVIPPGALPVPFFPIDGIATRNVNVTGGPKRGFPVQFLETSSPGLKGQSGGPIIDRDANIWGIQSKTQSFSLDFEPRVPNKNTREHQFLNVGWGTHASTIVGYLTQLGIKFASS